MIHLGDEPSERMKMNVLWPLAMDVYGKNKFRFPSCWKAKEFFYVSTFFFFSPEEVSTFFEGETTQKIPLSCTRNFTIKK
jgi:hypothetical protein